MYTNYKIGDPLYEGSDLIVLDAYDPLKNIGQGAEPINRGATGVVWKVKQANVMERAVKILCPEEKLLEQGDWEYFADVFEREMRKLARLTHSHLVKLITFGRIPASKETSESYPSHAIPYIVMEYVDGLQLHEFLMSQTLLSHPHPDDVVLDLLDDVLSALRYIHEQKGMHSDIKEMNILVRQSHRPEAILVDLGAAHIFTPDHDTTTYITTRKRVNQEWKNRVATKVSTTLLEDNRVVLDLYMFGVMLSLFLDKPLPDRSLYYDWQPKVAESLRQILGYGVEILKRIADKCLNGMYSSAKEVQGDLAASRDKLVSPLGIAELSMGTGTNTSLALPEDSVPLTMRMTQILNHPSIQRLRNISQLDFVNMIYLGATHSRLLHSVETYNLTRSYLGALLGDPIFRAYCCERSKLEAVLLAGFLHDLGHYPLGHIFEDFAFRGDSSGYSTKILRDEEVTSALLDNSVKESGWVRDVANQHVTECCKALRKQTISILPDMIQNLFGEQVLSYLCRIISDPNEEEEGILILRSIINGPMDVDKICYLRTDSKYSGATYGRAIDINSILASLTCTVIEKPSIAITEKGICAAESIATGRRWMYQRVYWHRTNRAIMAMIRFAPQYLLDHDMLTFNDYFKATYSMSDIEAVKWLNEKFVTMCEDNDLENPAKMILDGRRGIYKKVLEFSLTDSDEESERIRQYLMARPCCEWSVIAFDIAMLAKKYVFETKKSDILIDIPTARRHQIGDITVNLSGNKTKKLSMVSPEFRCTRDFFEKGALNCRIFIHPALRRALIEEKKWDAFTKDTYSYLKDASPR